ncbi:hypothetical protein MTZ49_00960 [Entomomonas sp. E2T0]|uniref:hypothetical protein n=1 Tax=Entomomonas sp. E2T0 TaxID=2930213 RepID=UPI0022282FA7|nr:hypothetical protein [Entomomonas sp. E2T0]UYZ84187.1 hypothetical protein MTZ49_00960 [Entomomonas sp. E2T0]
MRIHQQSLTKYRIAVAIRCLIAIAGGYALAATSNIFLALYLPFTPSEAVITANLLCLVILCIAVCWVFSVDKNWKALLGVLLPTLLCLLFNGLHQAGSV